LVISKLSSILGVLASGRAAKTSVDLMHYLELKVQSTATKKGCGALHLYLRTWR
jgi:hypothetical protein